MSAGTEGGAGRPDRAVALLAADVERLHRTVETVTTTANAAVQAAEGAKVRSEAVERAAGALTQQVAGLTAVGTQVAALADRVAELAARGGSNGTAGAAPPAAGGAYLSWFEADIDQAVPMLSDLAQWVYDVLSHYRQATQELSDCWRRHPGVVDALNALRISWLGAYRDPDAKSTWPVDWHIRHLPGIVTLLREELRGCSEHSHAPEGDVERWQRSHPRTAPDGEMLDEYALWWAQNRGDGVEPRLPEAPQPYRTNRP